ncbi:MAG: transposase [Chitinophagaceae bacterium]|nr:transposase [Chitinophagaceae bacterium]
MQNGFIERFNGSYRTELLNVYLFFDLYEVQELTAMTISTEKLFEKWGTCNVKQHYYLLCSIIDFNSGANLPEMGCGALLLIILPSGPIIR